jgi:hypothetical protein
VVNTRCGLMKTKKREGKYLPLPSLLVWWNESLNTMDTVSACTKIRWNKFWRYSNHIMESKCVNRQNHPQQYITFDSAKGTYVLVEVAVSGDRCDQGKSWKDPKI